MKQPSDPDVTLGASFTFPLENDLFKLLISSINLVL